jgi:hypothetical protein
MAARVVSARVRSARRAHLVLVGGESLLIGASAGLVTLAAAVAAGALAADAQAFAAAILAAILAAAAWWSERRGDEASVARAIDRNAGLSGALLTAFEAERLGSPSSLAGLLAARVAPAVSAARYLRESLRSSAALLAVPCVAAALWGLAVDGLPAQRGDRASGGATMEGGKAILAQAELLRSEAERLASSPGITAKEADELNVLAAEADRIRARAQDPGASPDLLTAHVREVSRRLEALRPALAPAGVTPGAADGTMAGPDARADRHPNASMKDPLRPDSAPPGVHAPGASTASGPGSAAEAGVGAWRWWPARYDAVVDRWIESRRAAGGGRPR